MSLTDPLNAETSVAAEVSDLGVKLNAKSRAIAALDRLAGNVVDLFNVTIEPYLAERRAKIALTVATSEAAATAAAKQLSGDDPELQRTFTKKLQRDIHAHANQEEVGLLAFEDLVSRPPSENEMQSGPATLSDEFLTRIEEHSGRANDSAVREKWARVLAQEIRAPGTFSAKTLRMIDELDVRAALLFSEVTENSFVGCLSRANRELNFSELVELTQAGLVVDPGLAGHLLQWVSVQINGKPWWALLAAQGGLAFPAENLITSKQRSADSGSALVMKDQQTPATPIYLLTELGKALSPMAGANELQALRNYHDVLQVQEPELSVLKLRYDPSAQQHFVKTF